MKPIVSLSVNVGMGVVRISDVACNALSMDDHNAPGQSQDCPRRSSRCRS
jgi:hypothetical protein